MFFGRLPLGLGSLSLASLATFILILARRHFLASSLAPVSTFLREKNFAKQLFEIDDDGFVITKGSKISNFFFKDIDEIAIKSFGDKKKVDALSVKFRKNRLDRDACFGLVQALGDDMIVIFDRYELSQFTLSKELRDRLAKFKDRA